jgi:phosphoenolpyruvate synthase/pyruvate phosphate dikinase
VGGKNASLGELRRALANTSVNVPDGFAISANAYRAFLTCNYLDELIRGVLMGLDTRDIENLLWRHVLGGHRERISRCRPYQRRVRSWRERRAGRGEPRRVLRLQAHAAEREPPHSPPVLTTGQSIGDRIASGPVRVVKSVDALSTFRDGEVLVADKADPDWEPGHEAGSRHCHESRRAPTSWPKAA